MLTLRCVIDDLLLPARWVGPGPQLIVHDGAESFVLEQVEALFYELVASTEEERLMVLRQYRLLRTAADFRRVAA